MTPTISPSSISECSESVPIPLRSASCSLALSLMDRLLLNSKGTLLKREDEATASVESGGPASVSAVGSISSFLSPFITFASLIMLLSSSFSSSKHLFSSSVSEAGEPVGSKGSYLSTSSSSSSEDACSLSPSPSVGWKGSYMSLSTPSLCLSLQGRLGSEGLEEGGIESDDGIREDEVDDTKSPVPLLALVSAAQPRSSSTW